MLRLTRTIAIFKGDSFEDEVALAPEQNFRREIQTEWVCLLMLPSQLPALVRAR